MADTPITDLILEQKREKRRIYMREWKRKQYAENPDIIKQINKQCYYKKKFVGDIEDIKRCGEMFPTYQKITSGLEELRGVDPELFRDIIRKYSFELEN